MKIQSVINWFQKLNSRAILIVFCILGFTTYLNAIFHPFVHDDIVFIKLNPYISDLNLVHIFNQTSFFCPKYPLVNNYYRPLLELFNRIQFQLYGLNPYGYHFTNVVIHILNSFILFKILVLFCEKFGFWVGQARQKKFAFIVSSIFLLHPVQTEAVSCIAGVSNLFSTFLSLFIFFFYLKTIDNQNRKSVFISYVSALAILFLGLLSKEQVIMIPVLILFVEVLFRVPIKQGFLRRVLMMMGYFGVCVCYFLLRQILFGHPLSSLEGNSLELKLRLLSIPQMILTHLSIIFWPQGLHYYRSVDILAPKIASIVIVAFIVLLVIWTVFKLKVENRRLAIFGLGWFLIVLLPTLNIVPLVNEYSFLLLAEHFLYLPIVGFLIFLWAVFSNWFDSVKAKDIVKNLTIGFILLMMICVGLSIKQNTYWKSEIVLFERTLKYEPNFGRARILLAKAYAYAGRVDDAIVEYHRALNIMNDYIAKVKGQKVSIIYQRFNKEIFTDLAHCYEAKLEFALAQDYYLRAITIDAADDVIYFNLGMNYIKMGQVQKAQESFEHGLKINSKHLMMKNGLALIYKESGQITEARRLLKEIVVEDPMSQSAKDNLNNFLTEFGD